MTSQIVNSQDVTPEDRAPIWSRRRFFIAGGASLVGAATLSACGGPSVVNTSGTVATTEVAPTAPPTTADASSVDASRSMLRTLTSVERSLAEFYTSFGAAAYVDADAKPWGALFAQHHTANATALEAFTRTAGGDPYTGTNEYLDEQLVKPGLASANAQKSSDNLIELAAQLEATGAATGTLAISTVVGGDIRQGVMAAAATNSRQAYLWRLFTQPGDLAGALPTAQLSLRDALPAAGAVDQADDDSGD